MHPRETVLANVPIPRRARPDAQLDAHMTVIDRPTGCEYDLYGAHVRNGRWQAVWGNSTRASGTGVYPAGLSSKGTGLAGAAGYVWPHELRSGRIKHALFFAYPYTRAGGPVAPATASDGRFSGPETIPQGARIQLDPNLDLKRLNLSRHERVLARAMQEYGMIVGDTGEAPSVYGVAAQSFKSKNPYGRDMPADGFEYLKNIPADRFRVLQLPAQEPKRPLRLAKSGCGSFR